MLQVTFLVAMWIDLDYKWPLRPGRVIYSLFLHFALAILLLKIFEIGCWFAIPLESYWSVILPTSVFFWVLEHLSVMQDHRRWHDEQVFVPQEVVAIIKEKTWGHQLKGIRVALGITDPIARRLLSSPQIRSLL